MVGLNTSGLLSHIFPGQVVFYMYIDPQYPMRNSLVETPCNIQYTFAGDAFAQNS
jgi:hypothetical protein